MSLASQSPAGSRLPVIMVSGFLGSGKTTFLQDIALSFPQRRFSFLVNELSNRDVDGFTLAAAGSPAERVLGGSIFCECKAGEFIQLMQEVVLPAHHEKPYDALFIETSGIADPQAIGTLINNHGMAGSLQVTRMVCVASPGNICKLLPNLPAIRSQVQTSNLILLNKTDLFTAGQVLQARQMLEQTNPQAEILECSYGRIDFSFLAHAGVLPTQPLATCEANPFTAEEVEINGTLPLAALRRWVEELPDFILRIKGFVETDKGWIHVEKTTDSLQLTPCKPQEISGLVIILHDDDASQLPQILESLPQSP